MIDRLEPGPRSEPSFEEAVKIALSPSGIGDTSNNFNGIGMQSDIPEFWSDIKPAKTFEGYIRSKYEKRPDIADAVMERSDKSFVAQYDAAMQKINETLGSGIKDEAQAERVRAECVAAQELVRNFCRTLTQ